MRGLFFLTISFLFMSATVHADIYQYGFARMSCKVSANRTAIGEPIKELGESAQHFAFQLFRSTSIKPVFTSYLKGDWASVERVFKSGGVPNLQATYNWTVPESKAVIEDQLVLPGGESAVPLKFEVALDYEGQYVLQGTAILNWSVESVRSVLVALGDIGTPDFSREFADLDLSTTSETKVQNFARIGWSLRASSLARSDYFGSLYETVQLHYHPAVRNGLSYHITIECRHFD